jgi:hypothetical protein
MLVVVIKRKCRQRGPRARQFEPISSQTAFWGYFEFGATQLCWQIAEENPAGAMQ